MTIKKRKQDEEKKEQSKRKNGGLKEKTIEFHRINSEYYEHIQDSGRAFVRQDLRYNSYRIGRASKHVASALQ